MWKIYKFFKIFQSKLIESCDWDQKNLKALGNK